jgi:energy-coupling factor transporter ATP-binding protein EcfA2
MKITAFKVRNYRTLEEVDLKFPSSYAAICGPNDSGKTNAIRAIRALVREDTTGMGYFRDEEEVSTKDHFPKWKDEELSKREISFDICLELDKVRDVGFYEFLLKQLSIEHPANPLTFSISVTYRSEKSDPIVVVTVAGNKHEGLSAQDVLKKLQSSRGVLFHNSTGAITGYYSGGSVVGQIREISGQHQALVANMKKTVTRGLEKISKAQQTEFEALIGRLKTKYKVGLSLPNFELGYMPYSLTLGDRRFEVPLDDWGSGTRNRTLVLLTLFRARQLRDAEPSAAKITPVMIVEEPESFLHPSAQAEFGRILHDLAEEFQVQVIVTTHSPYLLNLQSPSSNILFERHTHKKQLRETKLIDTSGENWMAPFGQALGLNADEFKPWKPLILAQSDSLLLVEGDIDKEYFELLRDESHGANQLVCKAEDIVPYGGTGSLSNSVLLRFVQNRHSRFFVTFDLDAHERIERVLSSLQLEKNKHYCAVGLTAAGKRNIEGLLPDKVTTAVYSAHPSLVQMATAGSKDEQESAKNRLKRLLLEEFRKQAVPGGEYFANFYPLVKLINKAFTS